MTASGTPPTSYVTRLRYARAIRAMSSADKGAQLLEAFEVEVHRANPTPELDAIEQLPDWRLPTLMHWICQADAPKGWTATDVLTARHMVLIGALAKASEQAAHLGDARTARALAQLAHSATLRLKGEAALAVALGTGDDEGGQS